MSGSTHALIFICIITVLSCWDPLMINVQSVLLDENDNSDSMGDIAHAQCTTIDPVNIYIRLIIV